MLARKGLRVVECAGEQALVGHALAAASATQISPVIYNLI